MRKVLVFGNSGSGKSTLAKKLRDSEELAHLDLDELAWQNTSPPQRASLEESCNAIQDFVQENNAWVIEGCYADLLEFAAQEANEAIFLNLPIEVCIDNARQRPWEPHKYSSKEAQDANLEMLLDWIKQYGKREDVFSLEAHSSFYNNFAGKKVMLVDNEID
ncbi:MAG: AAA family ATPase [Gammaproteobacteria bacterium]|nr:AAA family ATPase [Gammaproteobacteria bacterium]MBT3860955.1 AAA family ATPase [Gammaproteobacteria bacterium]MBT3988478.1 AAA family ATPase [Gammaproteobacteria bacterium]MBT4256185.1 AAA family ATPase [Gammaproteobacteria bacterium]MBT4581328.1 AAA family ATPase [Gammaproteobacteria bacterium]